MSSLAASASLLGSPISSSSPPKSRGYTPLKDRRKPLPINLSLLRPEKEQQQRVWKLTDIERLAPQVPSLKRELEKIDKQIAEPIRKIDEITTEIVKIWKQIQDSE